MDHFTKLLEELAKHLHQKQHFLRISMTKRVKNIAITEERNNTLWKTVSQGTSFTPWRTFENSTCLSGTKIKTELKRHYRLGKTLLPSPLDVVTLTKWISNLSIVQLSNDNGRAISFQSFLSKRKGKQQFSLWPAYPSSNAKHRNYAATRPQVTTQHCRYALWAKWQLRGTQIPQIFKKKKQRKADTPLHPGLQKCLTHGASHCRYAITIVITWESQLIRVDCIFF